MSDIIKISVDATEVARAEQQIESLGAANDSLAKNLDPLIRKEREFQRALKQVNDAVRLGVASQRQANAALKSLGVQYGYTTKQVQRMNLALVQGTRSFKRFGSVGLQQVGYQVGDFAVQLQGGTNAFVAFGQQGSQLLGIFGPMGAIAGAVLAIFTAFAAPLSQMEDSTGAAAEEMAKLKGELEPIATMIKNLGDTLKDAAFASINAIANNLQRVISYAAAFAAIWIGRLGIVYGIKAATFAMANFGAISAGVFTLLKRALITTGIGILAVALGEAVNMMLQLREATGSFGQAFGVVWQATKAAIDGLKQYLSNFWLDLRLGFLTWQKEYELGWADMRDRTQGVLDNLNAAFQMMWKGVKNAGISALNGVLEAFNSMLSGIYAGIDNLFGKIASLPGAAQLGITGTDLSSTGFKAETLGIDARSYQDIYSSITAGRQGMPGDRARGRAAAIGFDIDRLSEQKQEVSGFSEAISILGTELEKVRVTGEKFNVENLFGVGEAGVGAGGIGGTGSQLDAHVEALKEFNKNFDETIEKYRVQISQERELIGLSKEEVAALEFEHKLENELKITREQMNAEQLAAFEGILAARQENIRLLEEEAAATKKLEEAQKKVQAVSSTLASETVGALKSIVNGTKTASEAFRDMALNIIQQIMDILIWQPLIQSLTSSISGVLTPASVPGGSATGMFGNIVSSIFGFQRGGVFSAGNIVPFANGGIVGSPTMFGMSGGRTGLMGEAGPEAILPLKRGAGGKLGVEGGGNVTVNQTFNFAANGDDSVKKIIAEAAPKIAKMTEAQIINSRQRGGQMRRAFG